MNNTEQNKSDELVDRFLSAHPNLKSNYERFAPSVGFDDHIVIDDYLPNDLFAQLKESINSEWFPWYKVEHVAYSDDDSDFYFIHKFLEPYAIKSEHANVVWDIIKYVQPKAVMRCRALCYPSKENLIEHAQHMDAPFPHNTLILYLNSNDGFTRLADGTIVESVENRALIINGGNFHNSTNCTNTKHRLVFTINYF